MELHLVAESLKFMILGMGIVFVFLYLLVLLMRLQAYLIGRYFPGEPPAAPKHRDGDEAARVAAIVAAVAEHRRKRTRR
ncbi:OadG family transporter subunit [Nitratifractor sp.]